LVLGESRSPYAPWQVGLQQNCQIKISGNPLPDMPLFSLPLHLATWFHFIIMDLPILPVGRVLMSVSRHRFIIAQSEAELRA
jgi:hypothetical protein